MRWLLRVAVTILVALLSVLELSATSFVGGPQTAPITYDTPINSQAANYTVPERGPPTHSVSSIVSAGQDAVDQGWHGTLARPSRLTISTYTTYDVPVSLTQVDSPAATTRVPARAVGGSLASLEPAGVAANSGKALAKYDPGFALGQLTAGGRASASQLDEFGASAGWIRSQTATGPVKYTDANGVVRLTVKGGTPRAPGSAGPHVELRNADGFRVDPYGNRVTRRGQGNHTPIDWDW